MTSYKDLSAEDLFSAIRNLKNVYDHEVKKIFYDIKDEISKEEREKALYLLSNYRPNLIKEGRVKE